MNITLPALMRFSLRKCIAFSAYVSLLIICSCDKHPVGEMPAVQREKTAAPGSAQAALSATAAESPAVKPTPADFFPATKPD
jgi:hypothetical protein